MICSINGDGTFNIQDSPKLTVSDGYCVFEVKASGICGSVVSSIEAISFDLQSRLDARTGAEGAINSYISETLQLIQGYTK